MSDPLDELNALSRSGHDVDDWRRERIRAAAHRELGGPSPVKRAWDRFLEPGLLVALSAASLLWALRASAAILVG